MYIKEEKLETTYLNQEEIERLNTSNSDFKVMGQLELGIDMEFDWEAKKYLWRWKSSTEIANKLRLKSSKGLRSTLESYGATYKKVENKRGYITPPFKSYMEFTAL